MKSVTAKEMYAIDQKAAEEYQLSEVLLMENAGRAIAEQIMKEVTVESKVVVLVGGGNNGGDGFVIARTLLNAGYDLKVIQVESDEKITGAAKEHKIILSKFGCQIIGIKEMNAKPELLKKADVIIDALLGIGFRGVLKEPYRSIIEQVNQTNAQVIAVDLPSGIPAETNDAETIAVKADYTYIIEAPKPSTFIERYADYYGEWDVVKIGLPKELINKSQKDVWTLDKVKHTLPRRKKHSHKGSHGNGLVIGGSELMPGAAQLTAKAALRSGVGLLTVATDQELIPIVSSEATEATFMKTNHGEIDLLEMFRPFDAIVIGMGMGRSETTERLVSTALKSDKPVIIDADGLFFAKNKLVSITARKAPTILTPHPGEMAMLIDRSIDQIKQNPFEIAREFAVKYQLYLVLKGTYTIVTDPNGNQTINTTGNPGLAKGGSGDCLAGVILGQVMQNQSTLNNLANACFIHGLAADLAIHDRHTTIDLLATDLIDFLPEAFHTCLNK